MNQRDGIMGPWGPLFLAPVDGGTREHEHRSGAGDDDHAHVIPVFFFFNDTATTEIYTGEDTLSLHDALPI